MIPPLQQTYDDYVRGVLAGEIPAGKYIKLACERHLHDLATAAERGLFFDVRAAQRAIGFIECLRHSKGEWRGQRLILAGWQRFIIASLFGWKWRATGLRRYKRAFDEIPRKNGKSTKGAAVGLYMFTADGEGAPEVYTAATSKEQAKIVFAECDRMVKASPGLNRRIARYQNQLIIDNLDAVLTALHSKSENLDGLNTHCGIVDEYHQHKTSKTHDKIRTSTGSRRQSLIMIITTAGDDMESPCYQERLEAINVLLGVTQDDSLFVFIACPDDDDDWRSELTWAKANPNLGVSRLIENMREDYATACNGAAKEADFKRYFLNIWTNEEKRWIRLEDWRACDPTPLASPALIEQKLAGRPCFAGLDIASSRDTTALALDFPEHEGQRPALYVRFFMPRDNVQACIRRDRVPYDQWIRAGWIIETEGNVTDTNAIRAEIRRLGALFTIRALGSDPWNFLTLGPQLVEDGLNVHEVRQGFQTLSAPSKEFEKLILRHHLEHGGNPVMAAQVAHCVVETDAAENIKPTKKKSTKRIDGVAAAITAKRMAMDAEEPAGVGLAFL